MENMEPKLNDAAISEQTPSSFGNMHLMDASAEYTDCDGGCNDGNVDNS